MDRSIDDSYGMLYVYAVLAALSHYSHFMCCIIQYVPPYSHSKVLRPRRLRNASPSYPSPLILLLCRSHIRHSVPRDECESQQRRHNAKRHSHYSLRREPATTLVSRSRKGNIKKTTYPSGSLPGGLFSPVKSNKSSVFPAAFPFVGVPAFLHAS